MLTHHLRAGWLHTFNLLWSTVSGGPPVEMPEFKPPSPGRDHAAWDPRNMLATSHVPSLGLRPFICIAGIMKIAVWSVCGREKAAAVRGACSSLWLLQQKHMGEQPLAHTSQALLQEWNNPGHSLAVVCVCELSRFSHVWFCVILWTVARQAPLSMGFSRPECCALLQGIFLIQGIEPVSLTSPALTGGFFTTNTVGKPSLTVTTNKHLQLDSPSAKLITDSIWITLCTWHSSIL